MFHIVATHENKAAAGIDGRGIQDLQARLAIASAAHEGRRATPSADYPQDCDQAHKRQANAKNRHDKPATISANQFLGHLWSLLYPAILLDRLFFRARRKPVAALSPVKSAALSHDIGHRRGQSRVL
jgi:hypothetical protein